MDIMLIDGKTYLGGLLEVNEIGLPVDFHYNKPLTPTRIQAGLYGDKLSEYLRLEVIGKGLIEASNTPGVPVVVRDRDLLNLATKVKRPLCHISPTRENALGDVGALRDGTETALLQVSPGDPPIKLQFFDKANFPLDQHASRLTDCAAKFDLIEPLTRVRQTLELIKESGHAK